MSSKSSIAVVTGANRGIGFALVSLLLEEGRHVPATCRQASAPLLALQAQYPKQLDISQGIEVTSHDLNTQLRDAIGDRSVDLLINNAGILRQGENLNAPNYDSIREQFEVNAIGPLKITSAVLPKLADSAKLAYITSRMGSIEDNGSGGYYGYRMSKAALNMLATSVMRDLAGKAYVAILHPGMVRTEMIGGHGQIDAPDAAKGLLARIAELNASNSGSFWHANGERLPW